MTRMRMPFVIGLAVAGFIGLRGLTFVPQALPVVAAQPVHVNPDAAPPLAPPTPTWAPEAPGAPGAVPTQWHQAGGEARAVVVPRGSLDVAVPTMPPHPQRGRAFPGVFDEPGGPGFAHANAFATAPTPAIAAAPPQFDYFINVAGGPQRKELDEETAGLLNSERELAAKLAGQTERYKNSDESQKSEATDQVRSIVAEQFDIRQKLREKELAELEARLAKLRDLHARRQQEKDRIIGDRVQQILRDADGLGWGDATPGDVFFFKNGGGASLLLGGQVGEAPTAVSEDVLVKVEAAKADAARPAEFGQKAFRDAHLQTIRKVRDAELKAWEAIQNATELAERAISNGDKEAAWAANEARRVADEARHEAEIARAEAEREMTHGKAERARAAEQAARDLNKARQENERKSDVEVQEEQP